MTPALPVEGLLELFCSLHLIHGIEALACFLRVEFDLYTSKNLIAITV